MNFNPEIFRAYDIRGIYEKDFDSDFAFSLGAALVSYLNRTNFLVAHDGRGFSHDLARAVMRGMASAGADVQYLHLATLPFFNFAFRELGVNGGIMVTASHNAPEYGGFKIFGDGGDIIGSDSGLKNIKDLISGSDYESSRYGGKINQLDGGKIMDKYLDFAIKNSGVSEKDFEEVSIKVDGPELVNKELGRLLEKLGIKSREKDFDISFSFDADGDRLYVFDRNGQRVRADHVLGLFVQDKISFWHKPKVVYDFRISRGVLEKFKEWRAKAFRSKVGRGFVRGEAKKHAADISGELSGHFFFKENNYSEMPLMALLLLVRILSDKGKGVAELIEQFKTWFVSEEINIDFEGGLEEFSDVVSKVKDKFDGAELDELDGITVSYKDWWFNLRPSNTEPLLRLTVEAKTKNLLMEKVKELRKLEEQITAVD
ncbi:MAG: hypothetical protein WD898_02635 [Candidatus Paceibacterota bacterium]